MYNDDPDLRVRGCSTATSMADACLIYMTLSVDGDMAFAASLFAVAAAFQASDRF